MRIPEIHGVIERRILVNYRVDSRLLTANLPSPFKPKNVGGFGLVGICLIRLARIRPAGFPAWVGVASENAAHRAAVEWRDGGESREGVYIERRDTNLWLNRLAGGRFFPGIHHHALFTVEESVDRFSVSLRSRDGRSNVAVRGHLTGCWPRSSIFTSTEEASNFFRAGSLGYSGTGSLDRFDGMELRCRDWHVEPLNIDELHSSVFEDEKRFPKGSIEFDCALLMRNIEHEWHGVPELCCGPAA